MRRMTEVFLIGEACDILTTSIGIGLGAEEGNPLMVGSNGRLLKFLAIILIAGSLELYGDRTRFLWIIPILAWVPVVWNLALIGYILLQ
jgi:hypothetical protein